MNERHVKYKIAGAVNVGDTLVCEDLSDTKITKISVFQGYVTIKTDNGEILGSLDPFAYLALPAD